MPLASRPGWPTYGKANSSCRALLRLLESAAKVSAAGADSDIINAMRSYVVAISSLTSGPSVLSLAISWICVTHALGEFATVINLPEDSIDPYGYFDSDTQVNIGPGGELPADYRLGIGTEPRATIEINLLGGSIGSRDRRYAALSNGVRWTTDTTADVILNLDEGQVWGDIELSQGAQITLNNANVEGSLWVGDQPTACVYHGLYNRPATTDGSSLVATGGSVTGAVVVANASHASLAGGQIGSLRIVNNSIAAIADGTIGRDGYFSSGAVGVSRGSYLNFSGGQVNGDFGVSDGSLARISGGNIRGEVEVASGSSLTMSEGTVGNADYYSQYQKGITVSDNSSLTLSGGTVHGNVIVANSFASISGGRISGLRLSGASVVEASGGVLGPIDLAGTLTLSGDNFRIDGEPIEGLSTTAKLVEVPEGSVLSGVLSDGTPVALTDSGFLQDSLEHGNLALKLAPIPEVTTPTIDASEGPVPAGLRANQELSLVDGTEALDNFTALHGSSITIDGGKIGHGFEAVGSHVLLNEGEIGGQAILLDGATLVATGGQIGSNFEVGSGSKLDLQGGLVGGVFVVHSGGEVHQTGGKFRFGLQASEGSSFVLSGSEFKLDGVAINELSPSNGPQPFDLPYGSTLSGTLADGSPFLLGANRDYLAPGTLTLNPVEAPTLDKLVYRVPTETAPTGLRSGQTLLLSEGGQVGDSFVADAGSLVQMSGGTIGWDFRAVGSLANLQGGEVGSVTALQGSVVNLSGASVGWVSVDRGGIVNLSDGNTARVYVRNGGQLRVSGGQVEGGLSASGGSSVAISGGEIKNQIGAYGGVITVNGGTLEGALTASESTVVLAGGRFGDLVGISRNSTVTIDAYDVRLNGKPVHPDEVSAWRSPPISIDIPERSVLSGVFADGTPFAFTSTEGDFFEAGSLSIINSTWYRSFLPSASSSVLCPYWCFNVPVPEDLLPGATLTLNSQDEAIDNFNAGWGSVLTINGGSMGKNFEAVGTEVTLNEGLIGQGMDVFYGSVLNAHGGSIDYELEIHAGGVANLMGADFQELVIRTGGTATISGGTFGTYDDNWYDGGQLSLEPGSDLTIVGTEFWFNGEPVENFGPDGSLLIDLDNLLLEQHSYLYLDATLADGSRFRANLLDYPRDILAGWDFDGTPVLRLSNVNAVQAVVPEPSTSLMLALGLSAFACRPRRLAVTNPQACQKATS